ncbi:MAG TPA: Flp family type IVb pilin [Herpetosiphonaceae bacterium]|nr:Flp family type IVb pilin [Herpetosiphonaceae bacterium]
MLRNVYGCEDGQDFLGREAGQSLVEYALIIALVAIALVGALTILSDPVNGIFGGINRALQAASS